MIKYLFILVSIYLFANKLKRIAKENKLKNYFTLKQYNLRKINSNVSNETVAGMA